MLRSSISFPSLLGHGAHISHRSWGATLGTETFTNLDYADNVALLAEMLEVLLLQCHGCAEGRSPSSGRRQRSNLPLISLLCHPHFLSQATQLTSSSPLAQKSMPPVVRNPKSAVGSIWPKPASVSSIEEYGAPAFPSLLKFNYTMYTFNRSYSTVLKHGP